MPGPIATIGSMHVCPMCNGPVPHVGGPVSGPGAPNILINNKPAAIMGDMCVCVGPPDMIAQGEASVFFNGVPAVCIGSMTAHGGVISVGEPNVIIGTSVPDATVTMPVSKIPFPEISIINKVLSSISGNSLSAALASQNVLLESGTKEIRLSNLVWKNSDLQDISEAFVTEKVYLSADVEGVDNGAYISLRIFEKDDEGENDFVDSIVGKVYDNKLLFEWTILYREDNDDVESAFELQQKSYTLPEYIFIYHNSDGQTVESNMLNICDLLEFRVIDPKTELPLANYSFTIFLPNGELKTGVLDENGYAKVLDIVASNNYPIVFSYEDHILNVTEI